jgi:hypothetical protein
MVLRSTSFCFAAYSSNTILLGVTLTGLLQTRGVEMRRAALALGTVGIGAGILYAVGRAREKNSRRPLVKDEGLDQVGEGAIENLKPRIEVTSESKLPSMSPLNDGSSAAAEQRYDVDDRGTDQSEAVQILTKIKDDAFDSSDEKLALVLGRSVDEIQAWTRGEQTVDSDVLMKARALALERGLTIEEQE